MKIKFVMLPQGPRKDGTQFSEEAMRSVANDLRTEGTTQFHINGRSVTVPVTNVDITVLGVEVTVDIPQKTLLKP